MGVGVSSSLPRTQTVDSCFVVIDGEFDVVLTTAPIKRPFMRARAVPVRTVCLVRVRVVTL